jgi:hypothetical protein
MPAKKLQRALEVALDDFVSRRSEYLRYWLFGFLADRAFDLEIDLLVGAPLTGGRPVDVAKRRAEDVFLRRLNAASLHVADLTSARLTLASQSEPTDHSIGGVVRRGRRMNFRISALYNGMLYEAARLEFVAEHDPAVEQKSEPPFDEGEGRDT